MKTSSAPGAKEQRQKSEVAFFQLDIPKNATTADIASIKELILKNNTSSEGDVQVEGSIK